MITFVCWFWRGWRGPMYQPEHINALARQLARHMTGPWRLVAVTDSPAGVSECETVPLPPRPRHPGGPSVYDNWTKLRIFDRAFTARLADPGDWLVSIDLDALVRADLAPLFADRSQPVRIMAGHQQAYNSSLLAVQQGARPDLWDEFSPAVARLEIERAHKAAKRRRPTGSDQAWICLRAPGLPVWTAADGVTQWSIAAPADIAGARVVFFEGSHKPWGNEVRIQSPELYSEYRESLPA